MDENQRVDMLLCLHVIFPQGYGTHAQRSGSCLAIFLPGLTTVEPRLTTTPLIRPPRYYGHFILAQRKDQSVIFLFKEPL